jgi:hypothetical protein
MDVIRETRTWFLATFRWVLRPAPGPRWPKLTPAARQVERVVHLLDSAIPVPGTRLRVGLDPLLGLVFPGAGDAVGGLVSLGMMFLAVQYRVPTRVIAQMVFNVAVDAGVGFIPIVGDLFDFSWKANDRNFALLTAHRGDLPRRATLGYWFSVGGLFVAGIVCVLGPIALLIGFLVRTTTP